MATHPNEDTRPRAQLGVGPFFPGGGVAGDVLGRTDWSKSALGPMDAWSMSLKALVRAMLHTRQATCLFWGPELINLYNDGFIPLLAEKHPLAMGQRARDVWSDAWPVVGALLVDVIGRGEAVLFQEMLVPVVRRGQLEDAWWNYSYSPAFDDTGAIAGVLVVATETTGEVVGRKRWEAAKVETELARRELHGLAENQRDINERLAISGVHEQESAERAEEKAAQLNLLIEALQEGVVIADPSGRIRVMNEAARKILRLEADAAVHTTALIEALDLRDLDNVPLPVELRPMHRALHGESFAEKEVLLVHPDGETRRVVKSGTSILAGGKVVLASIVLRDVTDQRRLEQEREEHTAQLAESLSRAAESEARFRMMADNIPQLAWIADAHTDGQISWFNRGWLEYTGCTLEEMKGSGWQAVHHPDHLERVSKKFGHHVREGLDWEDTFPLRGVNGQFRWFLSRMKVIRDESGEVLRMFGTNTDITEEREADQFKEQFIGILGHDLRNPLNAILMGANALRGSAASDSQAKTAARIIRSARRMAHMVTQLLDLTRSRLAGGITIERAPTDLSALVTTVVDELHAAFPGRVIDWEPPGRGIGEWDGERLAQVVSNLIGNAIVHGDPDRPIVVRFVEGSAHAVVLAVQNYGPTIPPELLPTLFDPYRRGDAREAQSKGLGLGLFIAQQIVTAHGGRIDVRSTPDEGTTFRVTLPRTEPRTAQLHDDS